MLPAFLLPLLGKKWVLLAAAAVVAAIGGMWLGHTLTSNYWEPKYQAKVEEAAALKVSNDALTVSLKNQNEAMLELERVAAQRARQVKQARAEAAALAKSNKAKAVKLLTAKLPTGVDACTAASDAIAKAAKEARKAMRNE